MTLLVAACGSGPTPEAADPRDERPGALALDAGETASTDRASGRVPATTTTTGMDPPTPTTAGSGLPPVTTIAVSPAGDPDGIYRGVLGGLDPDQPLADAVIDPPTPQPATLPLTGLPGEVPRRPAAVVKIDNGPGAAPQTGLNAADLVIEEEVEGGVTRFAAVFHSTSSIVGPVRSGRTTDLALVTSLGSPLLLYSGANQVTDGILRASPAIQNRSFASSSGYWRDQLRSAPSNLYSDTAPHWASATGGPPPPQFHYRRPGEPAPGTPDEHLSIGYAASPARWSWDGRRWLRHQRGDEHRLASGAQVDAANVVVIEAERVDSGMVDAAGGQVPEFLFVGSGPATVFTDGRRIEGTWTRPTLASVATLTAGGRPIELTPGRTWIQLIERDAGLLG